MDKSDSKSPSAEAAFADVVEISKKMLARARSGEWQEVVTLEQQRETLLKNISTPNVKSAIIHSHIEQVLICDQQVTKLAKNAQQEIVSALEHLTKSRQGIDQYSQNQELG